MTETELKRQIEKMKEEQFDAAPPLRCREYRRLQHTKKFDRLYKIATTSYIPHAGYVDWTYDGARFVPTGKFIKYPPNSNCQRWIKRQTSKRTRHCIDLPGKGNYYRRLFDYWWTLY